MGFPVGGTGVGGSPVPPDINETQTTAFNESMKNVIGMLPFGSSVIVPFSQQEYEAVFHYRSEPDRPLLHPMLFLRTAGEYGSAKDSQFQPLYQELLEQLPPDMAAWLGDQMQQPFADRDPDASALHHTLSAAANAIGWAKTAGLPAEAEGLSAADLQMSVALPYIAFGGALGQADFTLKQAWEVINRQGPNASNFDFFNHSLTDLQDSIIEAMAAQREIQKGLIAEDTRERLLESASLMHKIAEKLQTSAESHTLSILGVQAKALATAATALALAHGTPALALGSTIALTGIDSAAGPFSPAFNALMDSVIDGVLNSFAYGAKLEVDELSKLSQELQALREER